MADKETLGAKTRTDYHSVPASWDEANMRRIPESDDKPRMIKRPDGMWAFPPIQDDISYGIDWQKPGGSIEIRRQA